MGNIILTNQFKTVEAAYITARSQAIGYDPVNVMDRTLLRRRFRADDFTINDYVWKARFVPTARIYAVALLDVNFSKVRLQGNTADTWGAPAYPGTDLAVATNPRTNRKSIYIDLGATGENYEYWRIFIPSSALAFGRYTEKIEIGTVCFLTSASPLSENISQNLEETVTHFYKTSVNQRVKTGELVRWEASLNFDNRPKDTEPDLLNVNLIDMSAPLLFYKNLGDTSEVYVCVKDNSLTVDWYQVNGISGGRLKLRENYMIGEN